MNSQLKHTMSVGCRPYPLVNVYITDGKITIENNSYVKLPDLMMDLMPHSSDFVLRSAVSLADQKNIGPG